MWKIRGKNNLWQKPLKMSSITFGKRLCCCQRFWCTFFLLLSTDLVIRTEVSDSKSQPSLLNGKWHTVRVKKDSRQFLKLNVINEKKWINVYQSDRHLHQPDAKDTWNSIYDQDTLILNTPSKWRKTPSTVKRKKVRSIVN